MDFLPTKGIEYLLTIAYLLLLAAFSWALARRGGAPAEATARRSRPARPRTQPRWFDVPEGVYFHRGHTWAVPEGGDIFRVGIDDFARRLLGRLDGLLLPRSGDSVEQGETGWRVAIDGRTLDLLSPVRGEVTEVNPHAVRNPEVVSEDPYGRGWLLKVRVPRANAALKNLLSGHLANAWMEDTTEQLGTMIGRQAGGLLSDGGYPVTGFGRKLAPDHWHRLAAELLLTADS